MAGAAGGPLTPTSGHWILEESPELLLELLLPFLG
jgi:hypothetical protein